jgi:hypothetical protein
MKKLKNVRLYGLFLFLLLTISSPSHAGTNEVISGNVPITLTLILSALLAFGFQMAYSDEDISGWPYPYKDNVEKIRNLRDEIEKWNPSSGPLFDLSNQDKVYWVEIATNFMGKKDELIRNNYDDYPKGDAAHPITRTTFLTIDQLEKVITKKGGPSKLFKPSENSLYWIEKVNEVLKQIESWDGVQPFTPNQVEFIKAATDDVEREQWMDRDNHRYYIGFHFETVYSTLDKLAKVAEKKGGKNILETGAPIDPVLKYVLDEIIETTKLVNEYDPKAHTWTARYEWIWRAISPSDREQWANNFFQGFSDQKGRFYKELDHLKKAFSKKVHLLVPGDDLFRYHNKQEEELMKEVVSADEIHAIGIEQKTWEIQYEALNLPKHKIKNGFIWGRDKKDDTPYCRLYQVTLKQQYAGGGTYNETTATYYNSYPRPCPETKS